MPSQEDCSEQQRALCLLKAASVELFLEARGMGRMVAATKMPQMVEELERPSPTTTKAGELLVADKAHSDRLIELLGVPACGNACRLAPLIKRLKD